MKNAVPIQKLGDVFLVTVQMDLHDQLALALQEQIAEAVAGTDCRGVLLDVSSLAIIDTFVGRLLADTARMVRLLGARLVVVGIRPEVALTLVDLGVSLADVTTARTAERGLEKLGIDLP